MSNKQERKQFNVDDSFSIEKYLITWGVWSEPNEENEFPNEKQQRWLRYQQTFVLVLTWFQAFKLSLTYFINDKRGVIYLGDFLAFVGGKKVYFILPYVCWMLICGDFAFLFYNKNLKKYRDEVIKPYKVLNGKLLLNDVNIGNTTAIRFARRVHLTLWVFRQVRKATHLIIYSFFTCIFVFLWPREDFLLFGIPWLISCYLWTYYCASFYIGSMVMFHHICYYLALKFEEASLDVKYVLDNFDHLTKYERHRKLWESIEKYCDSCRELQIYNKFWQSFVSLHIALEVLIITFVAYLVLFADDLEPFIRYTFALFAFLTLLNLSVVALSAAMVNNKA